MIATNQFGSQPLVLGDPDSLCVPTEKLIFPGPVFLDHYKCYVASGAPVDVGVALVDQFQGRTTLVLEPKLFCAPAEKNGEVMIDPVTHLTCYDTNPISGGPGPIPILNQFIPAADQLELLQADTLCVPSTKQLVPDQLPSLAPWGIATLGLSMLLTVFWVAQRRVRHGKPA